MTDIHAQRTAAMERAIAELEEWRARDPDGCAKALRPGLRGMLSPVQDYAASEQHEALSFRTEVERLGEDPDVWDARAREWSLTTAMTHAMARETALDTIRAMQLTSSETLDNLGLRIQVPRGPEPGDDLITFCRRLYGPRSTRVESTARAMEAKRQGWSLAVEFSRAAFGHIDQAVSQQRRAASHAAVIRAVTGHRAGERPRMRASVRAVLR